MTEWQPVGDKARQIYRSLHDPDEMSGVKRVDIIPSKTGGITVTVETVHGVMAVGICPEDMVV